MGNVFNIIKRCDKVIKMFDQAIIWNPKNAKYYYNKCQL